MRGLWETTDFGKTVRDYEFTRKAFKKLGSVVYSSDFEDKDSDTIFMFLLQGMELVSFKDYLKRYLYERTEPDMPFKEVPDKVYQRIIMDAFRDNAAPHSFEPTTKKWSVIVNRWLSQDSVRRSTVFLLGFGLRMRPDDVSEFLTKVLKEEDFRFSDPEETVYYYCYANDLRYAAARELLQRYADLEEEKTRITVPEKQSLLQKLTGRGKNTASSVTDPAQIHSEEELLAYLGRIKESGSQEQNKEIAARVCMELAGRVKELIAGIYQADEEWNGTGKTWKAEDITYADMEKMICSGIPVNGSGNLQKMSASLLNSHFRQRRFSRQRMDSLAKGSLPVERFDLITLLFFIYSQTMEDQEPEIRCRAFIDETNDVLKKCGMMELYPVNPYEAFVMMCLLSECPLATYSDIWELSYSEADDHAD